MSVAQAVNYMAERQAGGGRGRDPRSTLVSEVMSSDVLTADAEETSSACRERMRQANIPHLPVFSQGRLLGLVTMRDLLLADLAEKSGELKLMRAYIDYVPAEGGG